MKWYRWEREIRGQQNREKRSSITVGFRRGKADWNLLVKFFENKGGIITARSQHRPNLIAYLVGNSF